MATSQLLLSTLLALAVLAGIALMSRVRTAVSGNALSALALTVGVVATFHFAGLRSAPLVLLPIVLAAALSGWWVFRVRMIEMPQTVALFNGLGGGASALVGSLTALGIGLPSNVPYPLFVRLSALLAVAVGMVTLVGSLVAAGKLHRLLPQPPLVWPFHGWATLSALILATAGILLSPFSPSLALTVTLLSSSLFGLLFSLRVGGADMPVTISLLNSLSGVAGAIAGMAVSDVFLVAVGGIVGASGLLLTQIMCRAMNRSLPAILLGSAPLSTHHFPLTINPSPLTQRIMDLEKKIQDLETLVRDLEARVQALGAAVSQAEAAKHASPQPQESASSVLAQARDVIIVPGYGMALAQAQHQVRQLADKLESRGARVRFAIHPVAGRMPGHMNVLLAEADVDYEKLFEMDAINDQFAACDAVVVVGANDVLNPAARHAEGTPIYGMPVLNVDQAPQVVVCNRDLLPGYSGVDNPLYSRPRGIHLLLGDAKETLQQLISDI